jgi:hypothetical protein
VCNKKGHRYKKCFKATEQDKQKIMEQLGKNRENKKSNSQNNETSN